MMKNRVHIKGSEQNEKGFALIALMGVLAIVVIMATVMVPNMITSLNTKANETEKESLQAIGESSETYLRSTHTWAPTLVSHSTGYSPLDSTQITQNDRLFPRYYALHPNMSGFSNGTGLTETEVSDARFLLISNRTTDAAPTITNASEFNTWWTRDESSTPDLHMYRGNLADRFLKVSITAEGDGGSYQIAGTSTHSGSGTLADYTRYHLPGTVLAFDEANTYGTSSIQFTLTSNASFEFDPNCEAGRKWHVPGLVCSGEPAQLWLTTWNDTTGKSGVGSWNEDMVIAYGEPSLTYESGPASTTGGTFRGPLVDFHVFGASYVESLHFVSQDITIGSGGNTVDLQAGDILASDIHDVTMESNNSLFVEEKDVYVFRPVKPGDYSSGTFLVLFDGSDVGWSRVSGLTLVETATEVGGTTVQAGSFLMRTVVANGIKLFVPTAAGETTAGSLSTFYNQDSLYSFELVETARSIGDTTLAAGQILATTVGDGVLVGDNNLSVNSEDVFVLELTGTGGSSAGDATMLFDGSDAGLTPSSSSDSVVGITLSGTCTNWLLPIINPGFETGDLTGWTTTGDLFGNGGLNRWNAVTSSSYLASPSSGTYFASSEANGATGASSHQTGIYQRIDLSACATDIDNGDLVVTLTGAGHGQSDDPRYDDAKFQIVFYDAVSGGSQLGNTIESNQTTTYSWTEMTVPFTSIPADTRSIEVLILGTKNAESTYMDAGVDSIGGIIYEGWFLPIVNGDFETGDLTGWSLTGDLEGTGGINTWAADDVPQTYIPVNAHSGTYWADASAAGETGAGVHTTGIYQRIDLSTKSAEINSEKATIHLYSFGRGETIQDDTKFRIIFYDAVSGGGQVGSLVESTLATESDSWDLLTISTVVPAGTLSVEIMALALKVDGGVNNDGGVDDISAVLSFTP